MMQIGTNPSTTYHNQTTIGTPSGQGARSSSSTRQQQSQHENDQLGNIRPRLCTLRKWPHYDGYGVHLARNQHWLGLRIGDVEPNSPAESGGLLREDVVLAVNGRSVENDDFFVILSFIQHELEDDQIRFLVLDPQSVDLARRHQIIIDEHFPTCVRMETPTLTVSPEQVLYQQWRNTNNNDPLSSQNTINLGRPTSTSVISPQTNVDRRSTSAARENVFTFPSYSETNTSSILEPRLCSVKLRPGWDTIGISLQPDKDVGHIIKQVEPNSPGARAGLERGDCIISLNETPLLNVPYENVLSIIQNSRHYLELDFLVAKKGYLLKSWPSDVSTSVGFHDTTERYDDSTTMSTVEVLPSSNISTNNVPPPTAASETLEQLYNKYVNQKKMNIDPITTNYQSHETVSTKGNEEHQHLPSKHVEDDQYPPKQQQGKIIQGVGPVTADNGAWSASHERNTDNLPPAVAGDGSVRSTLRTSRTDSKDTKGRDHSLEDSFKPLQVGITNPSSVQQNTSASPIVNRGPVVEEKQNITVVPTLIENQEKTSRRLPSPIRDEESPSKEKPVVETKSNTTIQKLPEISPVVPVTAAPVTTSGDYEQVPQTGSSSPKSILSLAKIPLSELRDHGYELHDIQLMQPTEQNPVGLKLTKQPDPLQFIITAVAKGTKADLAGLKVNDWVIKIENEDIRTKEFTQISQQIRELLTNSGIINMTIARKLSSDEPSPIIVKAKPPKLGQQTPSESIGRSQGSSTATSILTTDITRDTPNNEQVRFVPEPQTTSISTSQPISPNNRDNKTVSSSTPLAIGLTNPISDETSPRPTRSISQSPTRSPTREYTINETKPNLLQPNRDFFDPKDIRVITMKEALGLDFNSFIPDGDSQIQTHFISNVQPSSMADKAGLRDGDRILTVNGIDVTSAIHEDVRQMMQSKKPLRLTVVNDPKYLELIENVRRSKKSAGEGHDGMSPSPPDYETITNNNLDIPNDSNNRSRSGVRTSIPNENSDQNDRRRSSDLSRSTSDHGSFDLRTLFVDDKGEVQVKRCILRKVPSYNGYGLLLRFQNGLHLIDQVEPNSPAHDAGLREDDIILHVDGKNAENMSHDDVKTHIRKLTAANTPIDLILMKKYNIPRYNDYKEKNKVDWSSILADTVTNEAVIKSEPRQAVESPALTQGTISDQNPSASPAPKQSESVIPGSRVCLLDPLPKTPAGFALSGKTPPPFVICHIDENSPASRAGLKLNDVILSINGTSVTSSSYEDTVKLVREALQQTSVKFVVKNQFETDSDGKTIAIDQNKMGSRSSSAVDQSTSSARPSDTSNQDAVRSSIGGEGSSYGINPVEAYQKQRNKELSYTLRLCHLHPTNGDGSQAVTFGFELSEDPDFEYPLILRVESQSPAEVAGLQSRDILLRINDRKTKGLGYEKVKKEIEKAKRDGRLEMLVVDQQTFDYCKRTKKPMKEPEMKIKHIFPKSRSAASFHKLPTGAAFSSMSSRDSAEKLSELGKQDSVDEPYFHVPVTVGLTTGKLHNTGSSQENESDNDDEKALQSSASSKSPNQTMTPAQSTFHADTSSSPIRTPASASVSSFSQQSTSQIKDGQNSSSGQRSTNSMTRVTTSNIPQTASATAQSSSVRTTSKDSKSSKSKVLPNAINNLFHKIGHHSKSSKRS